MTETDRVVDAYKKCGMIHAAAAKMLKCSQTKVRYHVARSGLPTDTRRTRDENTVRATFARLKNKRATARELGLAYGTVQGILDRKPDAKPIASGRIEVMETGSRPLPKRGVKRYIVTSAQNNTLIHQEFWENLQALAQHYKAEILVSRFSYNRSGFAAASQKPGATADTASDLWYDAAIMPYVCDQRLRLAPDLVFCGNLNILPTAVRPLSGLETYTGYDSCIVPHAKISMQSVPGLAAAKLMYTTGTVTQRNYLERKAGQKAEFHHAYAALVVEVDAEGDWFVRQLNASEDGTFYDLALQVKGGVVQAGAVEAIVYGDIHVEVLEPEIREAIWGGADSLVDYLLPSYQLFHDTLDWRRRNHHDAGDPHKAFKKFVLGVDDADVELAGAGEFLWKSWRPYSA